MEVTCLSLNKDGTENFGKVQIEKWSDLWDLGKMIVGSSSDVDTTFLEGLTTIDSTPTEYVALVKDVSLLLGKMAESVEIKKNVVICGTRPGIKKANFSNLLVSKNTLVHLNKVFNQYKK